MRSKLLLVIALILTLLLSACGPSLEPTMSPNDIANTALAEAWILVTQTQAAIPSATATITPFPATPTWTAQPTFTFVPTNAPASSTVSGAADPCNQPPPYEPKGNMTQVQFVNKSSGSVSLSFGMMEANSLGECGTYSFSIGRFDSPVVRVMAGCYWAYGWVSGDKPSTTQNISALCVENASQIWEIQIGPEVVEFQ